MISHLAIVLSLVMLIYSTVYGTNTCDPDLFYLTETGGPGKLITTSIGEWPGQLVTGCNIYGVEMSPCSALDDGQLEHICTKTYDCPTCFVKYDYQPSCTADCTYNPYPYWDTENSPTQHVHGSVWAGAEYDENKAMQCFSRGVILEVGCTADGKFIAPGSTYDDGQKEHNCMVLSDNSPPYTIVYESEPSCTADCIDQNGNARRYGSTWNVSQSTPDLQALGAGTVIEEFKCFSRGKFTSVAMTIMGHRRVLMTDDQLIMYGIVSKCVFIKKIPTRQLNYEEFNCKFDATSGGVPQFTDETYEVRSDCIIEQDACISPINQECDSISQVYVSNATLQPQEDVYKENDLGEALETSVITITCKDGRKFFAGCHRRTWLVSDFGPSYLLRSDICENKTKEDNNKCADAALSCAKSAAFDFTMAVLGPLSGGTAWVVLAAKYTRVGVKTAVEVHDIVGGDIGLSKVFNPTNIRPNRRKRDAEWLENMKNDLEKKADVTRTQLQFDKEAILTTGGKPFQTTTKDQDKQATKQAITNYSPTGKVDGVLKKYANRAKLGTTLMKAAKKYYNGEIVEGSEVLFNYGLGQSVSSQRKYMKKFFEVAGPKLIKVGGTLLNKAVNVIPLGCLLNTVCKCLEEHTGTGCIGNAWNGLKTVFDWTRQALVQGSGNRHRRDVTGINPSEIVASKQLIDDMQLGQMPHDKQLFEYVDNIFFSMLRCLKDVVDDQSNSRQSIETCMQNGMSDHPKPPITITSADTVLNTTEMRRDIDQLAIKAGFQSANAIEDTLDIQTENQYGPVVFVGTQFNDADNIHARYTLVKPVFIDQFHSKFPLNYGLIENPFPECTVSSYMKTSGMTNVIDGQPEQQWPSTSGLQIQQFQSDDKSDSVISIVDSGMTATDWYMFKFNC